MERILLVETSHRVGRVGLAEDDLILGERVLDEARRHARDLVPAVQELLAALHWAPRDIDAVFVSRGPGSYTGLRVGIMAAKTLAYALGCKLVGVDTFTAIAWQAPAEATSIDVWADAQQGKIYAQRFHRPRPEELPEAADNLAIVLVEDRITELVEGSWITGPGLEQHQCRLPNTVCTVAPALWTPALLSLLAVGRRRLARGKSDDPFALEPLYLRASAAEEKWENKGARQ